MRFAMENEMVSEGEKALKDQRERDTALDCTKSIHCESPAGAGKTSLLTERFIKLLACSEHPCQILALTFTNKAAGEMRDRISKVLRLAEQRDKMQLKGQYEIARRVLDRHRDKRHLLYASDNLRIMTFHSLCHAIVRASPLEAELPPETSVIEGIEYDTLLTQVTDDTLQKISALEDGNPKRTALENWLLRANHSWTSLRSDCINLLKKRDYLKELIEIVRLQTQMKSFREDLNETLGHLINQMLEKIRHTFMRTDLGKNWQNLAPCLSHCEDTPFTDTTRLPLPDALWTKLPEWQYLARLFTTQEGKPRKVFRQNQDFKACLKESHADAWIRSLPPDACRMLQDIKALPLNGYDKEQIQAIYDLIILVGEILSAWQDTCRQKGVLDFVGLELACLKVFNSSEIPDIQLILDSKINHILVDEFQDTSRSQWELLQKLCAGWSPGDGRTLFLVGDPKQSIYGFRKAEISLFMAARTGLPIPGQGSLPLESITLKHNFRSRPGLVKWTNRIFGDTIMSHPREDMDEVPYAPATATVEGGHQLSCTLFMQTDKVPDPQVSEARWLAQRVSELNQKIEEDEKIGILLFTRTRMPLYLQAFQDIRFPVMVTEGLRLKDRPEVLSIHQLLVALVHPHDDLAHVALLRSLWCWSDPDMLSEIWKKPNPAWVDKIDAYVRSSDRVHIKMWWDIVKKARNRVGRDPLFKIMKQAWLEIEGAFQLARWLGSDGVANVLTYLELLESPEMLIPEDTLQRVENALEDIYLPSPPEASRSRVTMMTVHKAKGLEFDHVFCPFLDWDPIGGGRSDQPPYLLEKGQDGDSLLAIRKDRRDESEDKIYRLLRTRGEEKRVAEAKRLFYVAVTRAKKGLYLSGVSKFHNGRIFTRRKDSPLSYLIQHEGIGEWELTPHDVENLSKTGSDGLSIQCNPFISFEKCHPKPPPPLPEPFPVTPETLCYKIITPSETKEGPWKPISAEKDLPSEDEAIQNERVRGIVIHRILFRLSQGYGLPSEKAVQGALYQEGIGFQEAGFMARSILEEIDLCMKDETFTWILRQDHPEAHSEWHAEDLPLPDTIRSGIIDRLIFDGCIWWIIDYKTAQKAGDDPDVFIHQQAEYYKSQMRSYRDLVSRCKGVKPLDIAMILYFTTLQKTYRY